MTSPLFRDPIHDGAADPTLIWNREERLWWMVYTNRRADAQGPRQSWFHGTKLGVASSPDGGVTWTYRGTLDGLDFEWGHNTFWAPEILWHEGIYHMYVSYIRGVPSYSGKDPRSIHHYTSKNLRDWEHHGDIKLDTRQAIDACVTQVPGGGWRMWYKDSVAGQHTYAADSPDLYEWTTTGPVIADGPHEGPNVFDLGGYSWMIVDAWDGQRVYRSDDKSAWEYNGVILGDSGYRPDDSGPALHADVVVNGAAAWVVYFTHPDRKGKAEATYSDRRSAIQIAMATVQNGNLVCDRNAEVEIDLGTPSLN
ncbi:family 43 glycosylhydrolase [Pseudarthrobacter sp. DSP2-3-2b1]|uniref:family 43 glycosylhydrolase n=1 Tax=Pseudarthrobacter sp. DSP2-3-2b1 TaxID=2804661 RepID=UPI003CF88822